MKNAVKIGYGLKQGKLVHVSDVSRGLACGCLCAGCHAQLVARKGAQRTHSFAHYFDSNCDGGVETVLHLLVKEIFQELKQFYIPSYKFYLERITKFGTRVSREQLVANGGNIKIKEVLVETSLRGFIPDISITSSQDKKLLIEIAVTHQVDRNKMRRVRKYGSPAMEIRLDFNDRFLTKSELTQKLSLDLECKHWLFHPNQKTVEQAFYAELRSARRLEKIPPSAKELVVNFKKEKIIIQSCLLHQQKAFDVAYYEFSRKNGRLPTNAEAEKMMGATIGLK